MEKRKLFLNRNLFLTSFLSLLFLTGNAFVLQAEEPEEIKPDGLIVENYRGGNSFSRKVSTSINVYSKNGTVPAVTHKSMEFNGVNVNYMEVVADGENTIVKVDYTGGKPLNMNQFYDSTLTKDDAYYLVGGINGGFFNNNSMSNDYGAPTGAVASNWKYVDWANGWTLTPAHGNGFTTGYLQSGSTLDLRYHGWNNGSWMPLDDTTVEYIENGIRYTLPAQYGLSGAYTLLVDGEVNHMGKEDSAYFNYNGGRSAVTLFGQREDGTFLLVTTQGGIGNGDEETKLMQELGAHNAYRLDGGGSTQLMYTEGLVNWHEVMISNMDGSVSYVKGVKDGQLLTDLEDPEREHYTFEGWYSTKDGAANLDETTKVDLKTYKFAEDTKLYAGWTRNEVEVTLMIDGQAFANELFSQGELYEPIAKPSVENGWLKEKDQFLGWFMDEACTIPYNPNEIYEGEEPLTLYGKVERYVPQKYEVHISVSEGGTVSPDTLVVTEGQDAIVTVVADHNYEVDYVRVDGQDVELDENGQLIIKNVQSNVKVEVGFKKAKINIQLVTDSGETIYESNVEVGFKMTVLDKDGNFVKELVFDKENTKIILETPVLADRPFTSWEVAHQQGKVTVKPKYGDVYKRYVNIGAPSGGGRVEFAQGSDPFNHGDDVTVNIIPDEQYAIDYVEVDGVNIGAVSSYTFNNIDSDHTVFAYFKQVEFDEGTVTVWVRDINEFNPQDLTGMNQTITVVDDGSKTPIDISGLIADLESKNYVIAENKVPVEVSYENSGDVYELTVKHKTQEETNKPSDTVYRTINVKYAGINLPNEVITQEGRKDYTGTRIVDLVTDYLISDYTITYRFDAYSMPAKDGFSMDVTEIPAVNDASEYTQEFTVVYTKDALKRYDVVVNFQDVNSVDAQDLSSYNQKFNVEEGTVVDISSFIQELKDKGYVLNEEVDTTIEVNGNKTIKVKLVHGTNVEEKIKDYDYIRTIRYEFDDDSDKNIEREQKVTLTRKVTSTKDMVTGKTVDVVENKWTNNSSKFPAVQVEKFENYKTNKTFISAMELKDLDPEEDKREYEIVVKFTRIKEDKPEKPENTEKPDKPVVNPGSKPNDGNNKPNSNGQTGNGNNGSLTTKPDNGHGDYIYNENGELVDKNGNIVEEIIDPDDPEVTTTEKPTETETPSKDDEVVAEGEVTNLMNNSTLWLIIGGVAVVAVGGVVIYLIMNRKNDEDEEDDDNNNDDNDNGNNDGGSGIASTNDEVDTKVEETKDSYSNKKARKNKKVEKTDEEILDETE